MSKIGKNIFLQNLPANNLPPLQSDQFIISEQELRNLDISSKLFGHYESLREIPTLIKEGDLSFNQLNYLNFSSKFEYNFLEKIYENYITNLPELQLPNFYDFVNNKILNFGRYDAVGIDGTEFLTTVDNIESIIFDQYGDPILSDKTTYVVNKYQSTDNGPKQTYNLDNYLRLFNPYKEQFPFYTEIKFHTHKKSQNNISDVFYKRDLSTKLMQKILNSNNLKSFLSTVGQNTQSYEFKCSILDSNFIEEFVTDSTFAFDLDHALQNKNYGYTEIIGYRLEKFEGKPINSISVDPIQEWFFPNFSETEINWIDTQIKYDKEYTYKLSYVVLTVALFRGKHVLISLLIEDDKYCAKYNNRLLDKPPMPPEIEFVPYIRIADSIKINFNTSTGRYNSTPIVLDLVNDPQNVSKITAAQDSLDNKITFEADDVSDFFQIFRIEKMPTSYEEFTQISTFSVIIPTNNSAGAAFKDTIIPNRKYYYIGRSIDYHGNFSNPTPVYEVQIINDRGTIYPSINVIDFTNKKDNVIPNKQFKRFLKLTPAIAQTIIEKANDQERLAIKLGSLDSHIWDKRFKVRITSKSSGKKVDFNLSFKYNVNYIQKPFVLSIPQPPPRIVPPPDPPVSEPATVCKDNNGNIWKNVDGVWYSTTPEGVTTTYRKIGTSWYVTTADGTSTRFGGRDIIPPALNCT